MARYVTLEDVKDHASGNFTSADFDSILLSLIERASEMADRFTRRELGAYEADASASVRYFDGDGGLYQGVDECVEVSTVSMRRGSGTTWTDLASTDYYEWPYNYSSLGIPIVRLDLDRRQGSYATWPAGRQGVKVSAKWGYSTSPPAVIEEAVIAQAIRWFKRGQQMFADASLMREAGTLTYAKKMDPAVQTLLLDSGIMKKQDLF